MPQGAFNEYSPQEQVAAARGWLQQRGLPMSSDNLNRAMMALSTGTDTGAAERMESAVTRTMAPRRAVGTATPAAVEQPVGGDMPPPGMPPEPANTTPQQPMTRGAQVQAGIMPGGRRGGTINGAQRIDEANPEAGMFAGAPPRQADETGVDQVGLAIALGLPLAAALGGGAMAGRGAASATRGTTVGRPAAQEGAEYMGRMPISPTGRVMDVPPTAIAGPAQRGMISGPGAAPPAISGGGPGGSPMIGGGGGAQALPPAAQAARIPSPRQSAARSNEALRTGPRRGQQGTSPAQNTTRNPGPRAGEDRPRPDGLRQRLMQRRAQEDARRAARTGRD